MSCFLLSSNSGSHYNLVKFQFVVWLLGRLCFLVCSFSFLKLLLEQRSLPHILSWILNKKLAFMLGYSLRSRRTLQIFWVPAGAESSGSPLNISWSLLGCHGGIVQSALPNAFSSSTLKCSDRLLGIVPLSECSLNLLSQSCILLLACLITRSERESIWTPFRIPHRMTTWLCADRSTKKMCSLHSFFPKC